MKQQLQNNCQTLKLILLNIRCIFNNKYNLHYIFKTMYTTNNSTPNNIFLHHLCE